MEQVYQRLGVYLPDSGYRGRGSLEKISVGGALEVCEELFHGECFPC